MADHGRDGNDRPTRMPKDMKGLLKFCIETTKNEDPTNPEHFEAMSEERKAWLEDALQGMTVSPVQRLQDCVHTLQGVTGQSHEDKVAALGEILEWVEQIDFAIDFHKIGGFEIISPLLHSEVAQLRWNCLELIATLVQNNPYCQAAVLQSGYLPLMLKLLDGDSDATVKTKALLAVSCLCRDHPEAQKGFVDNNGFSVLMRAMQSSVEKLKIKASFFLTHLCINRPAYKDILCDIGMIEQLIGHLSEDHNLTHEHLMGSLLSIAADHSRATAECRRAEFNLHTLLRSRIDMLQNMEEFQEEREHATQLLSLISTGDGSVKKGDIV